MTYEHPGHSALEYLHCRYGKSKLLFRGPRRKLEGPYAVFFGGTETYGKFVEAPFPALVEKATGRVCVNFGCVNAGVDLFVNDATLISAANEAKVTVVQAMGAQNMSNRFYAVHPRRNDRFLQASNLLKAVFREVDFTEFSFTRHMLSSLCRVSEEKFDLVVSELQTAWVARMKLLIEKVDSPVVLLRTCDERGEGPHSLSQGLGPDPLFVTDDMINVLRPHVLEVIEVHASENAWNLGTEGMYFSEMEAPAAEETPGPLVHEEIAAALADVVSRLVK